MQFDPHAYGPAVAPLLENARCNELGPGTPDASRKAALAALDPETLVAPRKLADREMALGCLAGLWLRHDFLDASHRISQDLAGASGSYWHGIMHRREGDFGNSKYWFRRVGEHPIFDELAREAARLAGEVDAGPQAAPLREQTAWDAFQFVDLCASAVDGTPSLRNLCMCIAQREWELLFDYCYQSALSG